MHFKNFEGKPERETPNRTISANGGLGPLQIRLELDTGPQKPGVPATTLSLQEVDTRRCANEYAGP